jgi:hypothetical protein
VQAAELVAAWFPMCRDEDALAADGFRANGPGGSTDRDLEVGGRVESVEGR